jgi:hypothetical protein
MSDTQISLAFTDIVDALKCIDHAAEQGAFKGWDTIRKVLHVRDRLDEFVVATNAQVNTSAPALS